MTLEPNPLRWSPNLKSVAALVTLVITIVGAAYSAATTISNRIYDFAKGQTIIIQHITSLEPRVDRLEKTVVEAQIDAASARQRVDDMKEAIGELKSLAEQNLSVSKSHTPDIKATRQAVDPIVPQGDQPHRPAQP